MSCYHCFQSPARASTLTLEGFAALYAGIPEDRESVAWVDVIEMHIDHPSHLSAKIV